MRCPNCDKTVSQKDKFCRFCGQPVVPPPPPLPPAPGRYAIPVQFSDFGPGEFLSAIDDPTLLGWGAHIYTGSNKHPYEIKSKPDGSPDWLAQNDWTRWYARGLTAWSHTSQGIGAMLASEGLKLLQRLQTSDEWTIEGIPFVEHHEKYQDNRPRRRRSRKKGDVEPEAPPEPTKYEKVIVETERLRLFGDAAKQFFAYLQANEPHLQRLVREEIERHEEMQRVVGPKILKFLTEMHREKQIAEFDPSKRKCPWVHQKYPLAFICEMPPDRATIKLDDDNIWWRPVIERPNQMKIDWKEFLDLEKAMDWVEQKIPELRAQDEAWAKKRAAEDAEERRRLIPLKQDLSPYWISPAALEPAHITFRAVIEIDYEPLRSKKTELSFGKFRHDEEVFHTPESLARELQFAPRSLIVEQITKFLGIYFVYSPVTYAESHLAAAEAQKIWDHSVLSERFRQGHIRRVRYGFEEIETEYRVWIGKLEDPQEQWPWDAQETREEYMSQGALRETLLRALDIHGYRLFADMPSRYMDDEKLLRSMHGVRAESRYQSDEARRESELWLLAHPQESRVRKQSAEST